MSPPQSMLSQLKNFDHVNIHTWPDKIVQNFCKAILLWAVLQIISRFYTFVRRSNDLKRMLILPVHAQKPDITPQFNVNLQASFTGCLAFTFRWHSKKEQLKEDIFSNR